MFVTMSLLLAAACLLPSAGKLTSQSRMRKSAAHFGIPWARYRLIGVAEQPARKHHGPLGKKKISHQNEPWW